jgi:hypothetical protein
MKPTIIILSLFTALAIAAPVDDTPVPIDDGEIAIAVRTPLARANLRSRD